MPIPLSRRTAVGIVAGAVALALAACDPEPPPPASPPPSVSAPASSASPTPTMSIQERDYAAAAEAFKNANRVIDEAVNVGNGEIPTKELAKYAVPDGRYWLTETQGLKRVASEGTRTDGLTKVVSMFPVGAYTPNQVSMYSCVDGRGVKVFNKDGTTGHGILGAARLTFRKADGRWRVLGYVKAKDGDDLNFQQVEQCEESPE